MTDGVHFSDARGPDGVRLYAIGDVHGRLDLLEELHRRIQDEIERDRPADWRIIHLGDYVDRGRQSRGVVERLMAMQRADARVIALAGNHDLGLLDFLAASSTESLFMLYGGIETAASYGVAFGGRELERFHAELAAAVPQSHLDFLRGCRFSAGFGDFFFCHAGIRPGVPLERQSPDDLVWIREPFLAHADLHPKVVVHGHTITRRPEVLVNRVNVDTGAWRSDVLTALAVEGSEKRLLAVEGRV